MNILRKLPHPLSIGILALALSAPAGAQQAADPRVRAQAGGRRDGHHRKPGAGIRRAAGTGGDRRHRHADPADDQQRHVAGLGHHQRGHGRERPGLDRRRRQFLHREQRLRRGQVVQPARPLHHRRPGSEHPRTRHGPHAGAAERPPHGRLPAAVRRRAERRRHRRDPDVRARARRTAVVWRLGDLRLRRDRRRDELHHQARHGPDRGQRHRRRLPGRLRQHADRLGDHRQLVRARLLHLRARRLHQRADPGQRRRLPARQRAVQRRDGDHRPERAAGADPLGPAAGRLRAARLRVRRRGLPERDQQHDLAAAGHPPAVGVLRRPLRPRRQRRAVRDRDRHRQRLRDAQQRAVLERRRGPGRLLLRGLPDARLLLARARHGRRRLQPAGVDPDDRRQGRLRRRQRTLALGRRVLVLELRDARVVDEPEGGGHPQLDPRRRLDRGGRPEPEGHVHRRQRLLRQPARRQHRAPSAAVGGRRPGRRERAACRLVLELPDADRGRVARRPRRVLQAGQVRAALRDCQPDDGDPPRRALAQHDRRRLVQHRRHRGQGRPRPQGAGARIRAADRLAPRRLAGGAHRSLQRRLRHLGPDVRADQVPLSCKRLAQAARRLLADVPRPGHVQHLRAVRGLHNRRRLLGTRLLRRRGLLLRLHHGRDHARSRTPR